MKALTNEIWSECKDQMARLHNEHKEYADRYATIEKNIKTRGE